MAHEPLSQKLALILARPSASGQLTLNELLERTEGRGLFTVIILLCLPFVAPVSVPGMSLPFGIAIALIAFRLLLNKPPRLPRRIGDRALPSKVQKLLASGGVKFLRVVEKAVRPRETGWMTWRVTRFANASLVMLMALILAIPFPPIPPFTNALPSYSIILLAASMMEEDGVLIWVGYFVCLFTLCYLVFWADVIVRNIGNWIDYLVSTTRLIA